MFYGEFREKADATSAFPRAMQQTKIAPASLMLCHFFLTCSVASIREEPWPVSCLPRRAGGTDSAQNKEKAMKLCLFDSFWKRWRGFAWRQKRDRPCRPVEECIPAEYEKIQK